MCGWFDLRVGERLRERHLLGQRYMRYAGSDACTDRGTDECTDGCADVGTDVHPERSTYISADGVTNNGTHAPTDCSTHCCANAYSNPIAFSIPDNCAYQRTHRLPKRCTNGGTH